MHHPYPRDERVFDWDPENMDQYWRLCHRFDQYPETARLDREPVRAKHKNIKKKS